LNPSKTCNSIIARQHVVASTINEDESYTPPDDEEYEEGRDPEAFSCSMSSFQLSLFEQ
jgi:hypothetical protein